MKNLKLSNCFRAWNCCEAGEKRLIFEESAKDKVFEGIGDAVGAVGDLISFTVDTLRWGVDMVKLGVHETKEGIESIWKDAKDPGAPDWNLPVYDEEMEKDKDFEVPDLGESTLDVALMAHSHLLFLNYKTKQYAEFWRLFQDEYKAVEKTLKQIRKNDFTLGNQIEEKKDRVAQIEKLLNDQVVSSTSAQAIAWMSEKARLKSQIAEMEKLCSFVVNWRRPEWQTVAFPPTDNTTKEVLLSDTRKRFVPNKNVKQQIDLRDYYQWFKSQAEIYKQELEANSFKDEKEKLAYHRDKAIEDFLEDKKKSSEKKETGFASWIGSTDSEGARMAAVEKDFENKKDQLEAKIAGREANIDFQDRGSPEPVFPDGEMKDPGMPGTQQIFQDSGNFEGPL